MAISRYQPNDVFAPIFDNFFGTSRISNMLRAPEADVIETENEIRVELDLPGLRPEDVDVSVESNILSVTGEKREERREGDEKSTWHLSERRYGKFSRSFVLPRDVDAENIRADFENGVLRVTIPKAEKARRRRITVNNGVQSAQN